MRSLRVTLGLVDPRSDPRVHAIVAEKQLPTDLLDAWAGWAWARCRKNMLSVAALVDTGHEVTCTKSLKSYVWHPGTGRWQHIRRVCGTCEMDFALKPFATTLTIPK